MNLANMQPFVNFSCHLLNQMCAGLWPVHTWFLETDSVWTSVCVFLHVCVSPPPRILITSGVIWTPYDWLNKFYSFYVAAVVGIVSRHGLSIDMCCENQPNKCKLQLFKPLIHFNSSLKWLYISSKMECFSYKGGWGMTCIEAFKRRAGFGYISAASGY